MRISSSHIGMDSERTFHSATSQSLKFSIKKAESRLEKENNGNGISNGMIGLTHHFDGLQSTRITGRSEQDEALRSIREQCMKFLLSLLDRSRRNRSSEEEAQEQQTVEDVVNAEAVSNQTQGNVLYLDASYYHSETESVSFASTGTVVTADGKEISFNMEMEMTHSFTKYYEVNLMKQELAFCDPLVINLDSNVASVSDQTFKFDIDADGILDEVSGLSGSSGYLSLDLNADGVINDGNELFGTKSGNGFSDLAQFDADKNGWIDENDEIWKKLMIWTKDENGKDQLYHLADKGVGAISLQNVSTDFGLHDAQSNQVNARIRNTGIFLYENGNVGTVQHLDLVQHGVKA